MSLVHVSPITKDISTPYIQPHSPLSVGVCVAVISALVLVRANQLQHYMVCTVLLVLVAVTITMTTLVVYMCLMMRRAKSGRVPQTTTGTTHTNNMAASDYLEPISLKYMQTTGTEIGTGK